MGLQRGGQGEPQERREDIGSLSGAKQGDGVRHPMVKLDASTPAGPGPAHHPEAFVSNVQVVACRGQKPPERKAGERQSLLLLQGHAPPARPRPCCRARGVLA